MEARTIRFDLGIWLVAAAAAMVVALAVWQVRPGTPLPAVQPRLAPTAAPIASPRVPGPSVATAPAIAPAKPELAPATTDYPVVTPMPVPARPTAQASGRGGAQNGPAMVDPGNPTSADDPPATQQASGESPPR